MKNILFLFILGAALFAADPAGFNLWTAGQLKGYEKSLAAKMSAEKVASEQLAKYGNHLTMIAHREGDGVAEFHAKQADLFVVQSGEATLVVGGEVVNPKTTAPDEIRGPSIKNGSKKTLHAGDVVHIPAKTAHQLLVKSGTKFTYFVIKVDTN
jgi:mannose-6-phosphate isomerase-like protein (cupin superfamily)